MDCPFPRSIPERGLVPCGKCYVCLKRKQDDWCFRLSKEYEFSSNVYFVTLTYRDEYLHFTRDIKVPGHRFSVLSKRDCQLFMKRLRKSISPNKIRYFLCGEYGPTTLRPHYHLILFNWPKEYDIFTVLPKSWNKGFTVVKPIHPNHFRYVAKYCVTTSDLPPVLRKREFRPFLLCSRRPAIGSSYLTPSMVDYHRQSLEIRSRFNGYFVSTPRYYRNKIFDDDMKAEISDRIAKYRLSKFIYCHGKTVDVRFRGLSTESYYNFVRRQKASLTKTSKI